MTTPAAVGATGPQARAAAFKRELQADVVDLRAVAALAFAGVPEQDAGLRSIVWKLLMAYLPAERARWADTLRRKRLEYEQFCNELIVDLAALGKPPPDALLGTSPSSIPVRSGGAAPSLTAADDSGGSSSAVQRQSVTVHDHPLSTDDGSQWKAYFQDAETREQIERDVERTHPDLHFFSGDTPQAQRHRAALRRALFVYAKLNPGLRYVQGMNELLAPLYYTFATDSNRQVAECAEADAFFCFVDLMASFRDHFCQQLDNSDVGIRATMSRLSSALRAYDSTLSAHLETTNKVNPQFYAFRWITTLLTQEFPFPDAVRLWDALLSDPGGREDCLQRICVAMVLLVREELLAGDFAANMKLLQGYPPVDVAVVLRCADELRRYKTVIVLD